MCEKERCTWFSHLSCASGEIVGVICWNLWVLGTAQSAKLRTRKRWLGLKNTLLPVCSWQKYREGYFFPQHLFFKDYFVLHRSWNFVFIVKINKAVALQYFNTMPYITATKPLYWSELKRNKNCAVSTVIILW